MWKNYVHVAAVIIEGAWKKRYGFKSLLGVVFIISVDTEEVLGFEIKCKHCFECRVCRKWDENGDTCKAGKVNENRCSINNEKSVDKYRKRRQNLKQKRKTKPADKGNYLSSYKTSVKHSVKIPYQTKIKLQKLTSPQWAVRVQLTLKLMLLSLMNKL